MRRVTGAGRFLAALVVVGGTTVATWAQSDAGDGSAKAEETKTLKLEDLFPEKSVFGPSASSMAFSHDGRYGAYLYRPYLERRHGSDLWIYDTETGATRRVTSVSVMSAFQETTRAVRDDRLEKAKKRKGRGKGTSSNGDDAAAPGEDPVTGDWSGKLTGIELIGVPPTGITVDLSLRLRAEGKVTGTLRTDISNATITRGRFDATTGELDCTLTDPESGRTAVLHATIDADGLEGSLEIDGMDQTLTITAQRASTEASDDDDDATGDGESEQTDDGDDTTDDERTRIDTVDEKDADDTRAPRYGGIQRFTWAPESNEMIFTSGGDLYRFTVDGDAIDRLTRTSERESGVQWLPDGAGYTYMLGGSALIRVRFDSHLIEQINPALPRGQSMQSYALSPDGTALAFIATSSKGGGNNEVINIITYRSRFAQVRQVGRHMSDNEHAQRTWHFYLYEIDASQDEQGVLGETYTQDFTGPRDIVHTPEWAPDASRACFATYEQSSGLVRVFEMRRPESDDAHDGDDDEAKPASDEKVEIAPARNVYTFYHHGGPNTPGMMRPIYLGDSRRMVMLTELSGFRQLHVLDPLYEQLDQITRGRFEIYPFELSEDRKRLYAMATKEHPTQQDVYQIDVETGEMTRLSTRDGFWSRAAVSDDGSAMLATYVDFGAPTELYAVNDGETTALTDSHPDAAHDLTAPTPEYFSYTNRHGQAIHGHMFKPDDWTDDDERPLLIYVYGGPLGQRKMATRGSFSASSYLFAYYMAKVHGYVTCTIDPRGASGYGGLFEKSNFDQVGKPQVEDLVDGAKWFADHMGVDAKRIGLHGWSFGGFQTQMCLYTEPDVFACGIAGAGPTEWHNYNSWYSTGTIGDSRSGKTDLDKYSLLPLAKNLKSKLLLIHGMEDANVLYQDTVRVYRELLKSGKETLVELFLDPTGGHGLGGDVKTLGRYRKYEEFLIRCLGHGLTADGDDDAADEDDD